MNNSYKILKKFSIKLLKKFIPLDPHFLELDLNTNRHIFEGGNLSYYKEKFKELSLNELFIIFRTDKAKVYQGTIYDVQKKKYVNSLISDHNYAPIYESIFNKKRHKIKLIVEIGSYRGSSSAAFSFYFFNSIIYCLDINFKKNNVISNKIKKIYCDQSNVDQINKFKKIVKKKFDLIIDDGKHEDLHIIISFNNFFNCLKRNGVYVIEDVTKEINPKVFNYFYNFDRNNNLVSQKVRNNIKSIHVEKSALSKKIQTNALQSYIFIIKKK